MKIWEIAINVSSFGCCSNSHILALVAKDAAITSSIVTSDSVAVATDMPSLLLYAALHQFMFFTSFFTIVLIEMVERLLKAQSYCPYSLFWASHLFIVNLKTEKGVVRVYVSYTPAKGVFKTAIR